MWGYLRQRALALLPTALVPIVFIFFLIRLAPGDPARQILGDYATQADVTALRHELGLDRPLLSQFLSFLNHLVHLNLGNSLYLHMPVRAVIPGYAIVTLQIGAMALVWGLLLGVGMGSLAAFNKDRWIGKIANGYGILGISIPSFFIAIVMIVILAVKFSLFDVGGYHPLSDGLWLHIKCLIMPSLSLGIGESAFIARVTRGALLDIIREPFVTTARAIGVAETRIVRVHIMRLAALQVLTVLGLFAAALVSGSVIMENIFGIPGMGSLLLSAVSGRDYDLIQGIVIFTGIFIIIFNLLIDVLYAMVDPRVQYGKRSS